MRADLPILNALQRIEVPPGAGDLPVPHFVDLLIRDAEDRAEGYDADAGGGRFVPGDSRYAYQVIQWLQRCGRLPPQASLLEWGSGQGVVSILASFLGLQALGVDLDPELVREAGELAVRYDSSARFVQGSYDPAIPRMKIFTAQKRDLVYVYPWPGEEQLCLRLFADTASPGAILLMCLGPEDIQVYRKEG